MKPTKRERATKPIRAFAPRPRILVADADVDMRALYRDSFTRAGCDLVEASDGREALVKAILQPPTLVITEISLPFIDGYALCEILRRDLTTADIPILVVTTETRSGQTDRARKAGADVVLIKPAPILPMPMPPLNATGHPTVSLVRNTTDFCHGHFRAGRP